MRRWMWVLAPLLAACATTRPAPPPVPPGAYGRAVLDTLTSDAFAGRGYDARGGAARTAAFLERRFAALGLQPLGTAGYRVPFTFTAAQVRRAGLQVDGQPLALGTDFLPLVGSTEGEGTGTAREALDAATAPAHVVVLRPAPGTLDARIAAALTPSTRAVVVLDSLLPAYGGTRFRAPVPVFAVRTAMWPGAARTVEYSLAGNADTPLQGADVVGSVRGTAVPDSFLVVTAHADHLGCVEGALGSRAACFPGANDNASGTAMLVALAREVAARPLRYTVVFAAMGAEEQGLFGAAHLAAHPPWPLARTRFLVNLDMTAGGRAITTFGGADHAAEFDRLKALLADAQAPAPTPRQQRPNSDHWPFVERGVPAFFLITGGGTQPYHSVRDVPETLDWDSWELLYGVTIAFLRGLAGPP